MKILSICLKALSFHKPDTASGEQVKIKGEGDITLRNLNSDKKDIVLKNVKYVPDLKVKVISIKSAAKNNSKILIDDEDLYIFKNEKLKMCGKLKENLYKLLLEYIQNISLNHINKGYKCHDPTVSLT